MADYLVVNATTAELTNVNAGGVDVPALSMGNTITLTDAELAALCVQEGVAVLKDTTGYQAKRNLSRILRYRSTATL